MKSSLSFAAVVPLFLFMFFGGLGVFDQATYASTNRSEEDSLRCLQQLSVASLALEKNMYNHAIGPWRALFNNCPDLSVRIYSDGVKLYKHFVESSENEQKRKAYLDTLLMVYDRRMKYFGDYGKYPQGWILGRKGMALVRYERGDVEALRNAYECFQASYSEMGNNTEPAVIIAWVQTSRVLSAKGEFPKEQFLEDYLAAYGHITSGRFKEQYNNAVYEKIISAVEKIFKQTEGCDCQLFYEVLASNDEIDQLEASDLENYLSVMRMAECNDSELYARLTERKYDINPSAEAAGDLARMFIKQGTYNKAVYYYEEAINNSVNDSLKAVFYYELAVLKDGHFKEAIEARQFAKRASALLPGWGKPHLLLGSIYARASAAIVGDEFEKSSVYWAAVDQFITAMNKDPECVDEARKQIEVYSQYFPDKQTCFFHGLDEGQEFVVGDWINEPTTVRFR